jgi:hypothetical protein
LAPPRLALHADDVSKFGAIDLIERRRPIACKKASSPRLRRNPVTG